MKSPEAIAGMWNSSQESPWREALEDYWSFVRPENVELEKEMDALDRGVVAEMDGDAWFDFLLHRYFRWKYTAANRLATTTGCLRKQAATEGKASLLSIKEKMFKMAPFDVKGTLSLIAGYRGIKGLGPAGASGLLALLWPETYGTGDQFVVKALLQVPGLPEAEIVRAMKPESLTVRDTVCLIGIYAARASRLNRENRTSFWTPRRIDKVLWTVGHWC